ncbi:hypothetical protein KFL_011870010, partial [Klebsormidium nitens]
MTPHEGVPDMSESLIGIRTRRGTLLQGANGAPEDSPGIRAGEQRLALQQEEPTNEESHREMPQTRAPSGEASGTRHVTAALALSAPENQEQTGGNVLREALTGSARSLEQTAGFPQTMNARNLNTQRNRLPRAAEQLEEAEEEVPFFQERGLRDRARGRSLAGETDSQYTLQGWLPEAAPRAMRRGPSPPEIPGGGLIRPKGTNSASGNSSGFEEEWEEYQRFREFTRRQKIKGEVNEEPLILNQTQPLATRPNKSDSEQASSPLPTRGEVQPPEQFAPVPEIRIEVQEQMPRPRTTERLWQDYGRQRTGGPTETSPSEPIDSREEPIPLRVFPQNQAVNNAPETRPRELSPSLQRQVASSPDPPPSPGGSDGFTPHTPRPDERRRDIGFTED